MNAPAQTAAAEPEQPGPPASGRAWRPLPLLITLCAGTILSFTLFIVVRGQEADRLQSEFMQQAGACGSALQRDVDEHLYILRSLGYFFASSIDVDRGEFRSFTRDDLARLPGIQALEWAPRVTAARRAQLEQTAGAEARKAGITDQAAVLDQYQIHERTAAGRRVSAAA